MLLRKFSQTLRVSLALMVATFSTGILQTATAYAASAAATADSYQVNKNSGTSTFNVTANDAGDTPEVTNVTSPINGGVATIHPNKKDVVYTPALNYIGTDTFTYTIKVEEVTGTGKDRAPTVTVSTATVNVTVNDLDTDGDGVKDNQDACVTPPNEAVGPDGCPVLGEVITLPIPPVDLCPAADFPGPQSDVSECTDTDEDGVMNSKDDCPDTTPGATVDNKGCETQANETPGNNGTLKIHEAGTPSGTEPEPGTENNDPKVCTFNLEGFGFDEDQDGYIEFDTQGGSDPIGVDAGPYEVGPADENGYFETMYFNDEDGPVIVNGTYKVTMYGKDTAGEVDYTNEKAKSKVFKVDCPPQVVETPVTPVVQFLEPTCEIRTGRVVISTTTGVTYKIDGVVKTAGTYAYPASTTVTVTAEIQEGFVLDAGATAEWPPHTFAAVPTNCGNLLGTTDVCPNIEGTQTVVPAGLIRNPTTGECFTPGGRGAFTPAQVLGAATALPETLPSTGGADSPLAIILASILAYGAAYFLQGRRLLGRKEALSA